MKESDWKLFKEIRAEALDRFCENALKEYSEIISDVSRPPHERYVYLYRIMENTDKRMALLFDDYRRSRAMLQLLAIRGEGLANSELVAQLSDEFEEQTNPRRAGWDDP
jgi:DNA-binding transcriptional regulator YbjK